MCQATSSIAASSVDDSSAITDEPHVEEHTASRTVEDLIDAAADLFTDMDGTSIDLFPVWQSSFNR